MRSKNASRRQTKDLAKQCHSNENWDRYGHADVWFGELSQVDGEGVVSGAVDA